MVTDNLVDVLTPMRKGANDDELKELFIAAVKRRQPYYKPLKTEKGNIQKNVFYVKIR